MLDVGKFSEPKQQKNDLGGPTENTFSHHINSCDGRVVKALDLKSNGYYPRRFKSCSQRQHFELCMAKTEGLRGPTENLLLCVPRSCDGGEFKAKLDFKYKSTARFKSCLQHFVEIKPMQVCCSLAREYGEVRLQYDNPL